MSKQIKSYTEEMRVIVGGDTTAVINYEINDSVETDMTKYGNLVYTVVDGNTVTQEKAAIEQAIKTAEGIS